MFTLQTSQPFDNTFHQSLISVVLDIEVCAAGSRRGASSDEVVVADSGVIHERTDSGNDVAINGLVEDAQLSLLRSCSETGIFSIHLAGVSRGPGSLQS